MRSSLNEVGLFVCFFSLNTVDVINKQINKDSKKYRTLILIYTFHVLVNFTDFLNYQLTISETNKTVLHTLASPVVLSMSDACCLLMLISVPQEPRTVCLLRCSNHKLM